MIGSDDADPRLESPYVERIPGDDERGAVTLVGVVHDHPASVYRARRAVEDASPAVLALELPPLAVPLYEQYATETATPPRFGGEFSAAIQAAETDDVVGVDGPSTGFVRKLASRLARERASPGTLANSARGLCSATRTAVACRVAAGLTAWTPFTLAVGEPTRHETSRADPVAEQAADEQSQIRAATSILDVFGTPPSSRYRSETREHHMADRVETLRERGDVVAVVGAGHFDPIRERFDGIDTN